MSDSQQLEILYAAYVKDPSSADAFFNEVREYACKVIQQKQWRSPDDDPPKDDLIDEASQESVVRVFRKLTTFKGDSKFSTWCHSVIVSALADTVRSEQSKGISYLPKNDSVWSLDVHAEDEDGGTWSVLDVNEAPTDDPADHWKYDLLEEVIGKLQNNDRLIVQMYSLGWKPDVIGKQFGKNAKWASNRLTKIKEKLKKFVAEG